MGDRVECFPQFGRKNPHRTARTHFLGRGERNGASENLSGAPPIRESRATRLSAVVSKGRASQTLNSPLFAGGLAILVPVVA